MKRPVVLAAVLAVALTGALACHRKPPAESTAGSTDTIQTPTGTSGTTATETGGGPPITTTSTTTAPPPASTNTAPVTTTTAATSTTGT